MSQHSAFTTQVLAQAQAGNLAAAAQLCQRALKENPQHLEALQLLALVHTRQGQHALGADCLQRALRLAPQAASLHNNLGNVYREMGQLEDAADCYREALRLDDRLPETHHNLAQILRELKEHAEAEQRLRRAVELKPDYAKGQCGLAQTLSDRCRYDEALPHAEEACRLDPNLAEAQNVLGLCLDAHQRPAEAVAAFDRALALNSGLWPARLNRALAWLKMGDYARGWPEYEWRWKRDAGQSAYAAAPRWDGSPVRGKTILLYHEQGLGDTFMFIRYAALVKQLGAQVLVVCPERQRLLLSRTPGIDAIAGFGAEAGGVHAQAPLMSLPAALRTTLETVPRNIPYLFAAPALVEEWKQRLAGVRGLRIGIHWQGNPTHDLARTRNFHVRELAPIAALPGVQLVSLQKGIGAEQLREAPFPVLAIDGVDEQNGPFMDTAAIIRNLDLVISNDTSIPHLAGGLGAPVFLALHFSSEWRWLLGRNDSPWYPTLRLFRQPAWGDWASVFAQMARELAPIAAQVAAQR